MEQVVVSPQGVLSAVGKDGRVRSWIDEAWVDLGNVSGGTWDESGAPLTQDREPKGLAVGPDGRLYVGTKSNNGSPEGKDKGFVWGWNAEDGEWEKIGSKEFQKEVKSLIVVSDDEIYAGAKDDGVWKWNGETWTSLAQGLVLDGDKTKVEEIALAPDGALWVLQKNSVSRRASGDSSFKEEAFFPHGEEIKAIAFAEDGAVWLGAKVGAKEGAIFIKKNQGWLQANNVWEQQGDDLANEVKQLLFPDGEAPIAMLGGSGGALRWNGTAWESITGSLVGNVAAFKHLATTGPDEYAAATKEGVVVGSYRRSPLTVHEHALKGIELHTLLSWGDDLLATGKNGGVYILAESDETDDGQTWEKAADLPSIEFKNAQRLGDRVILCGKQLLYELTRASGGGFKARSLGKNPGKAALDGDGNFILAGETEFLDVAEGSGGELYVGTKDGLFITRDDGQTWAFFNGPAEVKSVVLSGTRLFAAVKGEIYPDPENQPKLQEKVASVWSIDLDQSEAPAPLEEEEKESGWSCSSGGASLLAACALLLLGRRRVRAGGFAT